MWILHACRAPKLCSSVGKGTGIPKNSLLPSVATPHAHTYVFRDSAVGPRPGSSVPPSRTKTIAVASHCPPELLPQPPTAPWTIDDFTLLKKLYEGSLSVVCQVGGRIGKELGRAGGWGLPPC